MWGSACSGDGVDDVAYTACSEAWRARSSAASTSREGRPAPAPPAPPAADEDDWGEKEEFGVLLLLEPPALLLVS